MTNKSKDLKNYHIVIKVDGRYKTTVTAKTIEEAKEKAMDAWSEAEIGDIENVDGEVVVVTDDDDRYLFHKNGGKY